MLLVEVLLEIEVGASGALGGGMELNRFVMATESLSPPLVAKEDLLTNIGFSSRLLLPLFPIGI